MNKLLIALIVLALGLFLVTPVFSIWSLNTLFNLGIPVSTPAYFSMLWLHLLVCARASNKK